MSSIRLKDLSTKNKTFKVFIRNINKKLITKHNVFKLSEIGIYSNSKIFYQDILENDIFISLGVVDSNGWLLGVVLKNHSYHLASINSCKMDYLGKLKGDINIITQLEKRYKNQYDNQLKILGLKC